MNLFLLALLGCDRSGTQSLPPPLPPSTTCASDGDLLPGGLAAEARTQLPPRGSAFEAQTATVADLDGQGLGR